MASSSSPQAQEEEICTDSKDDSSISESTLTPKKASSKELTVQDIESGFDFETAEEYLLFHSRVGNLSVVEKLTEFKKSGEIELDINCKGKHKSNFGWTPLHLACYFGHTDVASILLQNKANVNCVNEQGDTPLHKASYTDREELVILLLSHDADAFAMNDDGKIPRDLARTTPVITLLAAAEKVDMRRREEKFLSASRNGDTSTLMNLLTDPKHPVNINCVDELGNSALHYASGRGNKETVIVLLKSGIDVSIKNKKNQLALNLAQSVQMKQLLQNVTPATVRTLPKTVVNRFEGPLLRKGRIFGWKPVWAVLERGVLSFFSTRADATTGTKRRGYKYLESALVDAPDRDPSLFVIYFSDKSKVVLALINNPSNNGINKSPNQLLIERQKWLNAAREHVDYSTNFIRQGIGMDDEEEDDLEDLIPVTSIQPLIQTTQAHHAILEKHIKSLKQLVSDNLRKESYDRRKGSTQSSFGKSTFYSDSAQSTTNVDSEQVRETWSSFEFHIDLILESSENSSASLAKCINILSEQDKMRQHQLQQEKDKCRVLEEALSVLAKEHHDLEKSLATNPFHSPPRQNSSVYDACSDTDIDETYYDAFDDEYDDPKDSDKTITDGSGDSLTAEPDGQVLDSYATNVSSSVYETPDTTLHETMNGDTLRTKLPAPMVATNEVSLWSILKHCIGKELSKITMPVVFNEPLSFLQRIAENGEYAHLLHEANMSDDPLERMELVSAFAVAALSSNAHRMNKPFNPLLGETYELTRKDTGFHIVCEQVSHHPPISAYHGSTDHFNIHGSVHPKLKFWGKSIEVKPDGYINVKLKRHDEVYTWRNVNCCVHNIIVGKLWFEQYGLMEIVNHKNKMKSSLNFKAAGWFGKDLNRLDGYITDEKGNKLRFLYGKWTDYLKTVPVENYEEYMKNNASSFRAPDVPSTSPLPAHKKMLSKMSNSLSRSVTGTSIDGPSSPDSDSIGGDSIPKSDSSNSLDIPNSRLLWVATPRPTFSPEYYHFTAYTMTLNQLDSELEKVIPRTDSRLRPDVRKLEEGDLEEAAAEKNRLEEKQRDVRKNRKKSRDSWSPLWFKMERNPCTKEEDWLYSGGYWDRNYTECPDIY